MKKYKKAAVGGTFDELHRGHKALLKKAFSVGENVIVGLTSDAFVSKMGKPHKTASYAERLKDLQAYLEKSGLTQRTEIVPLDDPYGSTLSGLGIDALVVSRETKITATKINERRKNAGLHLLKIFAISMIQAENQSPISTTRIRKGEIDREGHMMKSSTEG
jgi:cytidyltransferase-like protein